MQTGLHSASKEPLMKGVGRRLQAARIVAQGAYYSTLVLRDGASVSAARLLEAQARTNPTNSALMFEERHYNYADLNRRCNRVAGSLRALNAQPGDVLALWMDNRPEYLFAVLGANKLGVVTSLVNSQLRRAQLLHAVRRSAWM